jgi:hypothetical protein
LLAISVCFHLHPHLQFAASWGASRLHRKRAVQRFRVRRFWDRFWAGVAKDVAAIATPGPDNQPRTLHVAYGQGWLGAETPTTDTYKVWLLWATGDQLLCA